MKHSINGLLCLCFFAFMCQSVSAQTLEGLLSGAKKTLEKTITGGGVQQANIIGTWQYAKPAIELQSSNTIANIGGEAVSSTLSDKLSKYYEMVGLKPGAYSITFTEDGKVSTSVLGKAVSGVYSISEDGKTMNIGYKAEGKTYTTKVSLASGELSVMVGGDKLMSFIQSIVEKIPSSTVETINSLIKNYDGLLVGFTFTKSGDNSTQQ